mgnify:CR=1 FL=1
MLTLSLSHILSQVLKVQRGKDIDEKPEHDHREAGERQAESQRLAAREPVAVDDGSPIDTSFPGFATLMNGLGARIEAA